VPLRPLGKPFAVCGPGGAALLLRLPLGPCNRWPEGLFSTCSPAPMEPAPGRPGARKRQNKLGQIIEIWRQLNRQRRFGTGGCFRGRALA